MGDRWTWALVATTSLLTVSLLHAMWMVCDPRNRCTRSALYFDVTLDVAALIFATVGHASIWLRVIIAVTVIAGLWLANKLPPRRRRLAAKLSGYKARASLKRMVTS